MHKCIINVAGLVRFIVSVLGVVLAAAIGVIHTYIKSYTTAIVWRARGVLMIINYIILFKLERWRNHIGYTYMHCVYNVQYIVGTIILPRTPLLFINGDFKK